LVFGCSAFQLCDELTDHPFHAGGNHGEKLLTAVKDYKIPDRI
jgi:hypothetical protein